MRSLRQHVTELRRLRKPRSADPRSLLGLQGEPLVTELGEGAWLVRSRTRAGRAFKVQVLDDVTWLVDRPGQRGRRSRVVRRIGPPGLHAHLVIDQRSLRGRMHSYLHQMLRYLGEEHVAWVLRELDVNIVLDVGANRGQFAKRLRRDGYTGRIVSFEPVPEIADELQKAAARDPDWRVLRHALGDRDEEVEINVGVGQGRLSSLLPSSDFGRSWSPHIEADRRVAVSVRRLDGLFDEAVAGVDHPRVYLKLDTQGYDLQAFAGAGDRLAEVVGLQSELSLVPLYDGMPHLTEQLSTYESAGFQVTGMFPVIFDHATMRVIEFDAVMIRAGRLRARRDSNP